jgi:hypothetical protein
VPPSGFGIAAPKYLVCDGWIWTWW